MELINLGESSHMCAALIMYDGWQIAKDYPWWDLKRTKSRTKEMFGFFINCIFIYLLNATH